MVNLTFITLITLTFTGAGRAAGERGPSSLPLLSAPAPPPATPPPLDGAYRTVSGPPGAWGGATDVESRSSVVQISVFGAVALNHSVIELSLKLGS